MRGGWGGAKELRAGPGAAGGQGLWPMKPLMAFAFAVLTAAAVFGTEQEPDRLILGAEEGLLFENPLEELWKAPNGRRWLWGEEPRPPQEKVGAVEFRHGRPAVLSAMTTANYRGYVATYRLDGRRLVLVRIQRVRSFSVGDAGALCDISIGDVLERRALPIFADWYSGRMQARFGEYRHEWADGSYELRYQRDVFLVIKDGLEISRMEVENIGRNLYRTGWGLPWRSYGDEGGTDAQWTDARLVGPFWGRPTECSIRTRAAFCRRPASVDGGCITCGGAVASLLVYETPDWKSAEVPVHVLPRGALPADGTLVEIECRIVKNGERQELHVSSIRELKPSEALFHTDFPEFIAKWRTEMNAAREREAVEATKAPVPAKAE